MPASFAAWVPEFMATATSACASAGASLGAVAGHRHQPTFRLILADQRQLGFRRRFGEEIVDAGLGGDRRSGQAVIAGDHHRFNAHFAQLGETFFDAAFDDIFE